MTKKQRWIKKWWIVFLLLGIFGVIILINIHQNSTSYICSKNPEKCVCEIDRSYTPEEREKRLNIADMSKCLEGISITKFRLKTQAELDIDDCNNNPREDDLCKCEVWDEPLYNYSSIKLKSGELVKYTATMCSGEDLEISKNNVYEIEVVNATKCLKSRPKTECEKGNPDWVEEKECDYCHVELSEELKQLTGKPCYEIGTCLNYSEKTICREKTYDEKRFEEICKQTINYKVKT